MVANDCRLHVHGKCNIYMKRIVKGVHRTCVLEGALYIPKLKQNLYSIGQATKNGLAFFSTNYKCELQYDARHWKVVMEGKRIQKLYSLLIAIEHDLQSHVNNVHTEVKVIWKVPMSICHARMAHIGEATIKSMMDVECLRYFEVSKANDKTNKVCFGCILGKQH